MRISRERKTLTALVSKDEDSQDTDSDDRSDIDPDLAKQIREEIGINIRKCMNESSSTKSKLSEATEYFFLQEHITRVCPDKNKCVLDMYTNKMVQLRYRLGSLHCRHQLFYMEKEFDC